MKNLEKAIERAINDLPEDSVLKPFLLANKAEVKLMCITEYDEERTLRLTFEEGKEEGREEGREEGKAEGKDEIVEGMIQEGMPYDLIAKIAKYSIERVNAIAARLATA